MNDPAAPIPDDNAPGDPRHPAGPSDARFCGYEVAVRPITIAGRVYELLAPANADRLADDPRMAERFEQDEYMPYWAEFWSSSILLAEHIAQWDMLAPNRPAPHLLDLGCGLGLAGIVAAARGFEVTFADYDDDALTFASENARRNGVPPPHTRRIDWRARYPDLSVERIVAADVLYETRSLRPVAEFIQRHLSPAGEAIISDPNRTTAEAFDQIARHCGLAVRTAAAECPRPGGGVVSGRLFHLTHKEIRQCERPQ